MRRHTWTTWIISLCIVGCGGSVGEGLSSGTYLTTDPVIHADSCGTGLTEDVLAGSPVEVVVENARVWVGALELMRDGDELDGGRVTDTDYRPGIDCVLREQVGGVGHVLAQGRFQLGITVEQTPLEGAACEELASQSGEIPCLFDWEAEYVAAD